MAQVKFHKFVAALPAELEANAIYYVRAGAGFDIYVTNSSGVVAAYPLNVGGPGQAFFRTEPITATAAGQTVFAVPGGYTPGAVIVSLNGATLPPADYTAADGATVTLGSGVGIVVGSVLLVYVLSAFEVPDALPLLGTAADSHLLGGKPPSHYESSGGGAPLGFRLFKVLPTAPAWAKSGAGLITAQALTYVLDGVAHELSAGTIISLPALTAGNDYAIYATTDGRLVADLNWSAPSGEPAGTTRKIGGFHVALTGEIFEYSLWDINYRPTCPDPRGMVCINGMFWADIYLLGVNHHIDGTSRAGVTIADGSSPAKVPTIYGGDGSAAYPDLTWFVAQDVLQSHGKRCPSWAEFSMLAFGVTEATSVGTDPVTTKHDAPRRSRWGVEQAIGNMWVWGAETQGNAGGGWDAIAGGRGSVYHSGCTAVRLGAAWAGATNSGSRAAYWDYSPSYSDGNIGGRGLASHLCVQDER